MGTEDLARLEARSRVIRVALKAALMVCSMAVGFVVVAKAMPQRRMVETLEADLKRTQERERMVAAEWDSRRIELQALREDPAYLEIHARDCLDYFRQGERVLRFKREP